MMERQSPSSRRNGMRRRGAWLPALAGVLVLLGCSHENNGDDDILKGDAAIWSLERDIRLSASTTDFTAIIQRLDCNSDLTGTVLEPSVEYDDAQVTVVFVVEQAPQGAADCQANEEVPYSVVLSEPLGERELVDGACLSGSEALAPRSVHRTACDGQNGALLRQHAMTLLRNC